MSDEPIGWKAYRTNLLLLYETLQPSGGDAVIDRLAEESAQLAGKRAPDFAEMWGKLNEIEARLFLKLDDTRLREQTERKLVQAKLMELPGVDGVRTRFAAITGDDATATEKRRAVAMALLEDMFVRYSYRHAERAKRGEVAVRLTRLGISLLIVPLVLLIYYSLRTNGYLDWLAGYLPRFAGADEAGMRTAEPRIHELFLVIYFGFVGAYFSRLSVFQRDMARLKWHEMDKGYGGGAMAVRLLVGSIGAAILYFLMMGEVLSGALFPGRDYALFGGEGGQVFRPSKDLALLVVWSFIAGFSERFVPDRVSEVEAQYKVAEPPPPPVSDTRNGP